jgi:hypothetical protein
MTVIKQWCQKWNIPIEAEWELRRAMGVFPAPEVEAPTVAYSEGDVQAQLRLEASRQGFYLWRNNVGAVLSEGQMIRYGLANDSKKLNEVVKSSDLIGIKAIPVTQDMVGSIIGQFYSREVKEPGWVYTGTKREVAQKTWIELINANGGNAKFCTKKEDL